MRVNERRGGVAVLPFQIAVILLDSNSDIHVLGKMTSDDPSHSILYLHRRLKQTVSILDCLRASTTAEK
jgi:hypothetical protein